MKRLMKAYRIVQCELMAAATDNERTDALYRLGNLQDQMAIELQRLEGDNAQDMFMVIVDSGEPRIISQLEHAMLARWCKQSSRALTAVRVGKDVVNDVMGVL